MTQAHVAQLQAIHALAGSLMASVEALLMSMAPPAEPVGPTEDAPRTFGRKNR